MIKIRN